jgi:hypothetical protein
MPCCTPDNVDSFSCEPVGIIVEATCPDDPPPLPTTTTTTTTTEDPLLTTTTTSGPTTTPTPPIPYSVFYCSSKKCEADCCDYDTDLSYIYKPVLCQQLPDLQQAQRFRDDLTNHISYIVEGTCEENNDIAQESFCFECNDRCCTTTSTTEDPTATTTTTTQDPGLGACLLCHNGQILCTDPISGAGCDFFADIINANWSQHYPLQLCRDFPEVGDDCSGFTTTTTTEAPTTTPEPTTTTTAGPVLGCCRDCAADCDGYGVFYNNVTREFCEALGLGFDPGCFITALLAPCCFSDECPPCVTTTSIPGGGGDPDIDENPRPDGFEQ